MRQALMTDPNPIDAPVPADEPERADVADGDEGADVARRRYVRVLGHGPGDLVSFEFAIGWPDLAVELVLPKPMFEEFCQRQQAQRLPDGERAAPMAVARPRDGDDE